MELKEILVSCSGYIFSALTGVVAWFASSRKRRNDAIADMQGSIDMLVEKNAALVAEITMLREENSGLKAEIAALRTEIDSLKK